MTNLEKVVLFNNYFSGGLPFRQFGRTKLKFLGVSNNGFSGTIPDSVSMMSHLEYMYLDGNEFDGLLPDDLGRMSNLSEWFLSSFNYDCAWSLVLTVSSLNLAFVIESLNFNDNKFTGTIPSGFGNLRSMHYLSLQSNQLTGNIPGEIGLMTNLRKCLFALAVDRIV
jgi:hypothetical protein